MIQRIKDTQKTLQEYNSDISLLRSIMESKRELSEDLWFESIEEMEAIKKALSLDSDETRRVFSGDAYLSDENYWHEFGEKMKPQ